MPVTLTGRDELGRIIDVTADTVANVPPPGPEAIATSGGTTLSGDIEDALNGAASPGAGNVFATVGDTSLYSVLLVGNDAGGESVIAGLMDPVDEQDAATKAYVDGLVTPPAPLAAVLLGNGVSIGTADGNDTGGVPIVHVPAVDVDAFAILTATATGTGDAWTRPLAQVVDGNAVAGPRAEATGTGNTDACAYARTVNGSALADNDAAATGTGEADAGGYAVSVDGSAFSGGVATSTGSGNADASDIATANTGIATAGSLAVRGAVNAGMRATIGVDGIPMLGFNAAAAVAIPVIPATPTAAQIADVLVALGLATQGV